MGCWCPRTLHQAAPAPTTWSSLVTRGSTWGGVQARDSPSPPRHQADAYALLISQEPYSQSTTLLIMKVNRNALIPMKK